MYCKASFYYNFLLFLFSDPILGPTSFQAAVTNEVKTRQDELNSSSSSGEADPNNSNQTVIPANNDSIRSASELEVGSASQLNVMGVYNQGIKKGKRRSYLILLRKSLVLTLNIANCSQQISAHFPSLLVAGSALHASVQLELP